MYPTDLQSLPAGRRILFVHGSRDRIADPERSAALARDLGREAEVTYVCVEGGKHAMLRRGAVFGDLAAKFAALTLLGIEGGGPIGRIAAGERLIRL